MRGANLTPHPLEKRRGLLRDGVIPLLPKVMRNSDTLEASLDDLIESVREQGFEGIVAFWVNAFFDNCQVMPIAKSSRLIVSVLPRQKHLASF